MMKPRDNSEALASWENVTLAFLRGRAWNPSGATLLLAVSGGADSTALLRFFADRGRAEFGCKLHVAHIDHRLRAASAVDHEFTAALCRELDAPFHSVALDPALRPARVSTEMWARDERYRFFANTAARTGADFILTAHHRDDLVETVFQRLSRGTGPRGLAGIPFLRPLRINGGRCAVVRPFLSRTRAEILAYLDLLASPWREDESNSDDRFERNRFRLRYLPALRRQEKDLDARVFALAERMQSLLPAIDALEESEALLRVDRDGIAHLPEAALAPRVAEDGFESLRHWLKRLVAASGAEPNLVTREILREFVRQWKADEELQVPLAPALALRRANGAVYCTKLVVEPRKRRAREEKKACSSEEQRVILEAGVASHAWRWGDRMFRLTARCYPRPRQLMFPGSGEGRALFDADLFSCTLLVRTRRDGDRFSPFGVNSRSRKLKAFFNEEKIPPDIRDGIPIVLNEGTPAWVPGLGISDFFKVSGNTTRILELELENLHERHRRQEEQSGGR